MSALYPYPAIQYIPLAFQVIYQQESSPSRPFILIGREIFAHQEALAKTSELSCPYSRKTPTSYCLWSAGLNL